MSEFLSQAFAFPTVIFSVLLGFVMLYWLFVIIGALDLDVLDAAAGLEGAEGAIDGVAEGATEAAAEAGEAQSGGGGLAAVLSALGLTGVTGYGFLQPACLLRLVSDIRRDAPDERQRPGFQHSPCGWGRRCSGSLGGLDGGHGVSHQAHAAILHNPSRH